MVDQKFVVLGTGGTLAGLAASASDNIGYSAAQVPVGDLIRAIEPLRSLTIEVEQVAQVDSKDMSFEILQALALRCAHWLAQDNVRGIVVTHGTDTLEETAWFLQEVLSPSKPVVMTCAMRPASSLCPDGPQNLVDAFSVAGCPGAQGVLVVCAGSIHSARDVSKVHTYRLDAFDSGDGGPVGFVEEGKVRQVRPWPEVAPGRHRELLRQLAQPVLWPHVEVVMSYAGASARVVDALVAQGLDGLILAATGNGTLHSALEEAALRHQAAGLAVVRSTRCARGRVISAAGAAIVDSDGLSPVKARISLMLDLIALRA